MKFERNSDIFTNWSDEQTNTFGKDIITVKHRLSETGLFTDDALAHLLDKHPSESLDVCTMSNDHPLYPNRFRTGDFRDCDGKTLIEAVKAGKIWINVRRAMNIHPEYKAVLDTMYGAISDLTGRPAFNARGGVLISSPVARVPYHCDQTETILWHVRGKKRIYIYPPTEEFLPDQAYERLIVNDREDDVPYSASMDEHARVFDLSPDEMISWRLNAPHRVDNQTYCVSVTTEYSTPESALKNSVMYTNAVMRQRFGSKARWSNASKSGKYVKSMAGRVLRKAKAYKLPESKDMVTFKVNKAVKGFIQDVEPYERTF